MNVVMIDRECSGAVETLADRRKKSLRRSSATRD